MKRSEDIIEIARKLLKSSEEDLEKRGVLKEIQDFVKRKEVIETIHKEYANCIMEITMLFCTMRGGTYAMKMLDKIPSETSFIKDVQDNLTRKVSASFDKTKLISDKIAATRAENELKDNLEQNLYQILDSIVIKQAEALKYYAQSLL